MADYEDNKYPEEFDIPIWDENPLPLKPGDTPWGYYDNDTLFQIDALKFSKWAARRLGYPIVDIEMQSGSFYACFEEAINEYAAIVNQYNMRDNMMTLQGNEYSQNTNISQKVIKPNMGRVIEIATEYGMEAGVGGTVAHNKGWIDVTEGTQIYDLETAVSQSLYENGIDNTDVIHHNIEIKQVYHYAPPAINRYFNPFLGSGNQYLMSSFGWDKLSGVNYIMMPMFNDLLRIQAIEFSDQIRRSAYSFQIIDNKIKIFPIPKTNYRIYFDYIFKSDRNDPFLQGKEDGSLYMSDASNIPYGIMTYKNINAVGRQWITKWGLALCKEYLGAVRAKYQSIPSLNTDVILDGSDLRQQAQSEREALMTELKETLEQLSRKQQMLNKQEEANALTEILTKVPTLIYIA